MVANENWENVRILGRTPVTDIGLDLIWSGSGVEFIFRGLELGIKITGGDSVYQPWISLIMDGAWIMHMPVQEGTNKVIMLKGLDPSTSHNIRIIKETQAMPDDPDSFVVLNSLLYDGEISKTSDYKYRIEFIGDSITSGEGLIGAHDAMDWISPYFSTINHYGVKTAHNLNAEYRLISQSGWGVSCGWDNNIYSTLPLVYESDRCQRGVSDHDFNTWKADAVVINLGTNDEGAFRSPEYVDPETSAVYKKTLKDDGSYRDSDIDVIKKSVISFLKTLRKDNPDAQLVWVYGMIGYGLGQYLEEAVNEYVDETKDTKASYLALPDTEGEGFGSRQHPGAISHAKSAEIISAYLKEKI